MKCYKCNKRIWFWQARKARLHVPCFDIVFKYIQDRLRDGVNHVFFACIDKIAHKRLFHFQAEMAMIDMKKELGVRE